MRVILFNLYPYRLQRERRRKKRVISELAVGAALGLLLCWSVTVEFSRRVEEKQAFTARLGAIEEEVAARVQQIQAMKDRVAVLKRQVNALTAVEKESVLASQWVSYFDATVPANVSLTRLFVTDREIVLNGMTPAVSSLGQWVNQMEAGNRLFSSVDLVSVTEQLDKPGKQDRQVSPSTSTSTSRHLFEIRALLREAVDAIE
ncbi:MAG TPA: hypothetical protein VFV28_06435 [Limnobacter sp.]|nr:hypothetical protein [Limnobacter sp.]